MATVARNVEKITNANANHLVPRKSLPKNEPKKKEARGLKTNIALRRREVLFFKMCFLQNIFMENDISYNKIQDNKDITVVKTGKRYILLTKNAAGAIIKNNHVKTRRRR